MKYRVKRSFNIFVLLVALYSVSYSQNDIKWLTLEEAEALNKIRPKKVFIKISTEWCEWCKKFNNTTLSNTEIKNYLTENYYPVELNPEHKQKIIWKGNEYKLIRYGHTFINEWALIYLHGQMSFPSIVILDEELNLIQAIPGYIDKKTLSAILNYFGTNSHKTTPWHKYQQIFDTQKFLFSESKVKKE